MIGRTTSEFEEALAARQTGDRLGLGYVLCHSGEFLRVDGQAAGACGLHAEALQIADSPGVTPGTGLDVPETATTVRVEDGKTLVTDGPFVDIKEAIGGFLFFEADDLDAAIELAARIPAARLGGAVEVRPTKRW